MDGCVICGSAEPGVARLKVPFPTLSPSRGQNGWGMTENPDVPTWTIFQCLKCGVYSPRPRPPADVIKDFYATAEQACAWEVEHYVEPPDAKRQGDIRAVEKLERLIGRPGRLLEIGPAAGWLLKAASDRGWAVAGIEAAPKFQRYATHQLGLDVRLGTIDDHYEALAPRFDVIVLRDVLEHLYDPVADLSRLSTLLAPGGRLVIETPKIDSLAARFYGLRWRQIVSSHTFYWTRRSLRIAIENAGMTVVSFSEPRYWDPDPRLLRRGRVRELLKLVIRGALFVSYVRPSASHRWLRRLPATLTLGHWTDDSIRFKVGDQPVLGDVLHCVAAKHSSAVGWTES